MDVVVDGDFKKLVTRGRLPESYLLDVWEGIIRDNDNQTGVRRHQHYFKLYQSYASLLADYTLNRLLLMKLTFSCEWETIQEVRDRGFKIDTSSRTKFSESITNSLTKCENLLTKIQMKYKQIAALTEGRQEKTETFEDLIAFLEINGFKPDYSITLKQFNANTNLIKKKYAAMESNRQANRPKNGRANRETRNVA